MSSTEYRADRRDVAFILNEVMNVQALCQLPAFSEFDQETFNLIIEEASNFGEKVAAPLNEIGDRQGCRFQEGSIQMPDGFKEAWKQMGEGAWIGLNMPADAGGQGLPELVSIAANEVIYAANQSFFLISFLTTGAAHLIQTFGNEEQKSLFCEKMYSGEWTGTMCLTEPHAGTAVGDVVTTAEKKDNHYLIKGSKQFITCGDHDLTDNIIHLVLARAEGASPGPKGISLFIVPKIRLDGTPNDVTLVNIEHKMGINASPTALLSFGDQNQCHGYLLQAEHQGMAQMFQMMNESRLLVGLQGLAASAAAYQYALSYANERTQGIAIKHGKNQNAPRSLIVEHPDVRRMLMNMKATTEGLRGLVYACGYFTDMSSHGPEKTRAHYKNLLDLYIPIAKAFGTDQGFETACTGIQVLGGVGYTNDFPLEQNARDVKIGSIYEGTNGIQALDLVSRKFTMKDGELLDSLKEDLQFFEQTNQEVPEEIRGLIEEWQEYYELMFELIQEMKGVLHSGDSEGYVLYANNMLALMGDVLCAFHLLKQAAVAQKKFSELEEKAESVDVLLNENPDAVFLWNKVRTAEHYVYNLLPRTLAHSRTIKNKNRAPLESRLTQLF
ncbi:MAG: acyl-CoA dehydrogenase [SAR324 cluster bacterium]|nr:acyl-CoA dehydrogenase [SAR324 cluster bacterium]